MPPSIEFMAWRAFREGRVSPEMSRFAAKQIEARGIGPAIERANAQLARAFGNNHQNEAA